MNDEQAMYENDLAMNNAFQFGAKQGYLSPMNSGQGSILILTNPENDLYKLELSLRNMRLDNKGNPVSNGEALMNDLGVSRVMGMAQSIISQITIMSNFEEKHIKGLIDYFGDTLASDLMQNKSKYAIKNGYDRDAIYFQTLTTSFTTMMRAFEQGEKRFWKGSQQEITTRIEGAKSGNKGFFNNLIKGGFK